MDSTLFSNRCNILANFYTDYINEPDWSEFFSINNIGFPAAVVHDFGMGELNDKAIKYINETWIKLCNRVDLDPDEDYDDLEDFIFMAGRIRGRKNA
jgi:hypothetical protein